MSDQKALWIHGRVISITNRWGRHGARWKDKSINVCKLKDSGRGRVMGNSGKSKAFTVADVEHERWMNTSGGIIRIIIVEGKGYRNTLRHYR